MEPHCVARLHEYAQENLPVLAVSRVADWVAEAVLALHVAGHLAEQL